MNLPATMTAFGCLVDRLWPRGVAKEKRTSIYG